MLGLPAVRLPHFRWMDPHEFERVVARLAPETRVLVPTVLERYDLQLLVNRSGAVREEN
jgi:hypothetical protein